MDFIDKRTQFPLIQQIQNSLLLQIFAIGQNPLKLFSAYSINFSEFQWNDNLSHFRSFKDICQALNYFIIQKKIVLNLMIGQNDEIHQALNQRAQIVDVHCQNEKREKNMLSVQRVLEISQKAGQIQDALKKNYIQDLLIGGTRDWESFEVIDGKSRFDTNPPDTLENNSSLIRDINEFPVLQIREYQCKEEIQEAKDIILNNLDFMSIIAGEKITKDDVEKFFNTTKFYQYIYHNQQNRPQLTGLSSYNGLRTYVNLFMSNKQSRVHTMIHEIAHNFSRFRIKIKNIRRISPETNINLRYDGKMIEAGNWIENKLFGKDVKNLDPFSLRIE